MLDVMKHCLTPAGINPKRRTAELTVAILQLVASGRGIAALPVLDRRQLHRARLRGLAAHRAAGLALRAVCRHHPRGAEAAYIREFIALTRTQSLTELAGVSAL